VKRISLDVWIQLIGMVSIVFSLLFVGLQMQQSQTIALASQQQARTEVLVDIIGGFDEGDKSFVDLISGIVDGSYVDDSNVVRDAIWQIWMLYENDFLQYKLGLMDDEVWEAKLNAMLAIYNACNYRDITDLVLDFSTAELSILLSETSKIECP
tara:strand:- start:61 stop:522 length:462 start_codon:yes stop_codon:yes gene_type:complete